MYGYSWDQPADWEGGKKGGGGGWGMGKCDRNFMVAESGHHTLGWRFALREPRCLFTNIIFIITLGACLIMSF